MALLLAAPALAVHRRVVQVLVVHRQAAHRVVLQGARLEDLQEVRRVAVVDQVVRQAALPTWRKLALIRNIPLDG